MPPAASHSPTRNASQGSIILVEEYDALAAAITSALRKFAPRHVVHVARTLTEAESLTKNVEPALFVIDFDPPFPGLSPFLQELQSSQSDARVLLIAGKLPPTIAQLTGSGGALQFVEKPFDIPDFGAAIQALLGPWRESDTEASRGTIHDVSLADLLIAQCAGGRTVAMEIITENGKSGEIHLRQGTPSHAEADRKTGDDALREMLSWRDVEVRERERPRIANRTIDDDWPDLVTEILQRDKPRPRKSTKPAAPAAKPGKKLVIVDDTEMLLIFVEDVLMTGIGGFEITTAPNGISGVKEIERARPDLVLLDYSLPDINGDEVCRRLLENPQTEKIPVLMMSGHVPEMSKAAATLDNVVATIAKPFLSDALVSLVQQTLAEGRAVRKTVPVAETPPAVESATLSSAASAPDLATPTSEVAAMPPTAETGELVAESPSPAFEPPPAQLPILPPPPAPEPEQQLPVVRPPIQESAEPASGAKSKPPSSLRMVLEKARRAMEQRARGTRTEQGSAKPATSEAAPESPSIAAPEAAPSPSPFPSTAQPAQPTAPAGAESPDAVPNFSPPRVMAARVISEAPNEVVLSLFLNVVSVQLTPELRMGSIRARPSTGEVSLHVESPGVRAQLPETGFTLGPVGLDERGRIATVRLVPTSTPFKASPTQHSLQIGSVTVVPIDSTNRMQLTPMAGAPMTLQLVAHLELAGVELSPTFQVAQIILKTRGLPIRVTMNSQSASNGETGTACETVDVLVDHSARLKELLLNPVR